MRLICKINTYLILLVFFSSCANQNCEEDLSFKNDFYALIDSIEVDCEKAKDNRNVIGLDIEEQGQNIGCLSEITKISSKVTLGYYFGYKNYDEFLEDKSQWIEWYEANYCNSVIIEQAVVELFKCQNSK
jgi:hypothetical protein